MRCLLLLDVTQRILVVIYRRYGTTWWPNLQGSSRPRRMPSIWPWTKGPVGCSETSVNHYQSTLRNILEERRSSDVLFYGEQLLGCRPPPRLEAHPLTAVLACLSKIFVATNHIYRPSRCVCVRACETWLLQSREERGLKFFENRLQGGMFELKREQVTGAGQSCVTGSWMVRTVG
jgi:hypothetical protein